MNMEFSVPTKAKKLTLYLIIVGAVLTLIGIANNYKSDFFSQFFNAKIVPIDNNLGKHLKVRRLQL